LSGAGKHTSKLLVYSSFHRADKFISPVDKEVLVSLHVGLNHMIVLASWWLILLPKASHPRDPGRT